MILYTNPFEQFHVDVMTPFYLTVELVRGGGGTVLSEGLDKRRGDVSQRKNCV